MNIGSDTGGSVRAPAAYSSLYGNRPSIGAISTKGVLSMSPQMDTLAFVARSAKNFAAWGKAWYAENTDFKVCGPNTSDDALLTEAAELHLVSQEADIPNRHARHQHHRVSVSGLLPVKLQCEPAAIRCLRRCTGEDPWR